MIRPRWALGFGKLTFRRDVADKASRTRIESLVSLISANMRQATFARSQHAPCIAASVDGRREALPIAPGGRIAGRDGER